MKLGIICSDYSKENIERLKNFGVSCVEFCINYYADNDAVTPFCEQAERMKKDLDEANLTVSSVGRWGAYKILPDGSHNEEEFNSECRLIDAAHSMGCKVYVTNCNYIDDLSLFANYETTIKYLERLIAYAKQYDIKIGTNNCHWNNYVTCDPHWSVIHGHLKDLYIKYDPSHSVYRNQENYLTEVKKWGDRFIHVHLKGSLLVDGERIDDPPAGLDMTNWPAFIGMLYAKGYQGALSIEPHSATWQGELGEKGIQYTVDYFKKLVF